jgi:hypothetical protein
MSASQTQRSLILHLLQAAQPGWVPAPALARISLQYSARIHELRRAGWLISNKVATVNGKKHGSFRLGPPETSRNAELRPMQNFFFGGGELSPERHRDDG